MNASVIQFDESRNYFHYRIPRHLSHHTQLSAHPVKGVDLQNHGGILRFEKDVFTLDMAKLSAGLLTGCTVFTDPFPVPVNVELDAAEDAVVSETLDATESDLKTINGKHAIKAQTKDSIRVYNRFVVNDYPARNGLWFTKRAMDKFALDFEQGRSRLLGHDNTQIIGRTFKASVKRRKIRGITANWVEAREYVLNIPANEHHLAQIDGGVYAYDSIGFAGGKIDVQELEDDESGRSRFFIKIDHDPAKAPPLEAGEVSYVFLGMIYGAGNDKMESRGVSVDDAGNPEGGADPAELESPTTQNEGNQIWLSWP